MDRNSFIMYVDSLRVLHDLTNEQAGMLFKTIAAFQEEDKETLHELLSDFTTRVIFRQFETYFERDASKYSNIIEKRREAGKRGGAPKGNTNASRNKQNQAKQAKQPDSDSVSVSVSDTLSKESLRDFKFDSQLIKRQLLSDEIWKESACMQSTLGMAFMDMIPSLIDNFFVYIVSIGEEQSISNLSDAKRRFTYWWNNHGKKEVQNESKQEYIIPD